MIKISGQLEKLRESLPNAYSHLLPSRRCRLWEVLKLAPIRKGIVAARLAISDEIFVFSALRAMQKHRIRTEKAKNCRKRLAPKGLERMTSIFLWRSLSQYLRGINMSDLHRNLRVMHLQRGSRYLFERGLARQRMLLLVSKKSN